MGLRAQQAAKDKPAKTAPLAGPDASMKMAAATAIRQALVKAAPHIAVVDPLIGEATAAAPDSPWATVKTGSRQVVR